MGGFDGKVAIVNGAGIRAPDEDAVSEPGVGASAALKLALRGASVVVVDVEPGRADRTCARAPSIDAARMAPLTADGASRDGCQAMVELALARFGRLDVLINNVATSQVAEVVDTDDDLWDRTMAINAKSVFLACRAAIPAMLRSGGGSIVTISSVAAVRGYGTGAYAAAKGAGISLMVDIAGSYGPHGIRANVVMPGHIRSAFKAESDWPGHEHILHDELRRAAGPLGTHGLGQDVADAAVFLASDEARWITGVVLPVDAGTLAVSATMMFPTMRDVIEHSNQPS